MSSALLPVFQAVPLALRAKKTEMGREVRLLRKRQLPVLLAADWPVQLLVANSPQELLAAQLIALLRDFSTQYMSISGNVSRNLQTFFENFTTISNWFRNWMSSMKFNGYLL